MNSVLLVIIFIALSLSTWVSNAKPNTEINIAPLSNIYTTPYIGYSVYKFVDGEIDHQKSSTPLSTTPLPIKHQHKAKLELEFRFNAPQTINKIRIYQTSTINRNHAISYKISYKSVNGSHRRKIAHTENNAKPYKWFEYSFSPAIITDSIHIQPIKLSQNKGPSYGGPLFSEVEILSKEFNPPNNQHIIPLPNKALNTFILNTDKSINIPQNITLDRPWEEQFQKGLFASIWYFEDQEKKAQVKVPKYQSILNDLGVTRIWLYLNLYLNANEVIVPKQKLSLNNSKLQESQKVRAVPFKNDHTSYTNHSLIDDIINRLHANNIGIIGNEPFLPVKDKSWGFPKVFEPILYPCLLTSEKLHGIANDYYNSLLNKPFDGITIGGDEFFFYGHTPHETTQSLLCKKHPQVGCNSSFKESFSKTHSLKDKENLTKINIHEYKLLAELFKKLADKVNEKGKISTSLLLTGNYNRQSYGVAQDIIGHHAKLDEMSIDPYWSHNNYLDTSYFSIETKKILAATPNRKAHITLQATPEFNAIPFKDDIMIFGPAIAAIMHGISGINFYKIDHLLKNGLKSSTYNRIKKIFNLIRFLEQNEFTSYKTPKHIALLYSRSGEDEWQINNYSARTSHAVLLQNAIIQVLIKNSIPFDIFYLDQPKSIPDLSQYDLALIPFNYSIDPLVLPNLKTANNILSIQPSGQYIKPANKKRDTLISLDNIYHLDINLDNENHNTLSDTILGKISTINDMQPPLKSSSSGDTECSLVNNKHDYLLYCINWGEVDIDMNIDMNIPDRKYDIWAFDTDKIHPVEIDENKLLNQNNLINFMVKSPRKSFKIYLFDEVELSGKHIFNLN